MPHLWTGQRRRRSLSRRISHCSTIPRHTGSIAGHRRRTSGTSGVNHRSTTREATNSRHHRLHQLRHVFRKASIVRSCFLKPPSFPCYPKSVAPWHQSNGETRPTAFCVARHTERLPHLGTGLSGVPALQSLPPHNYSCGRFRATDSPFSSRPHRSRRTPPPKVSRLHILPHCS
jgi:hypothetical protein